MTFLGSTFTINSEKEQILDLLISTFEDAVIQNRQLEQREEELQSAKAQLARYAGTLEERLRSVLESVPDVLFSMSADGSRLHYLSPASTQVLGFTPRGSPRTPLRGPRRFSRTIGRRSARVRARRRDAGQPRYLRVPLPPSRRLDVAGSDHASFPCSTEPGGWRGWTAWPATSPQRIRMEQQVRLAQKLEAVGTLAGEWPTTSTTCSPPSAPRSTLTLLDLDQKDAACTAELQEIGGIVDRGAALTRQLLAFSRRQVLEAQPLELDAIW